MHTSLTSCQHIVYVHLSQYDGNIVHVKCGCKAGQGGCCKHVAALLSALLDFYQMDLK